MATLVLGPQVDNQLPDFKECVGFHIEPAGLTAMLSHRNGCRISIPFAPIDIGFMEFRLNPQR